ncbi:DNA-binding protein [Candidatus Bathyarchaeota archaeon]|nr:MAG: DNA-binding protein [Candidatus Bathyarchaeota archaeon]
MSAEEDEELERLRRRRLLELQLQQRLAEEQRQAAIREEMERRKDAILRRILTSKARQRLPRPAFTEQLELQLIQIAQSGRVKLPITDQLLKRILIQLQSAQRRETRIRRI